MTWVTLKDAPCIKKKMREHHLDGLRGWASLFVVFSHLGPMFLLAGHQFPAVPFFWDGQLAVYVFFVLSGYVLSVDHFRHGRRTDALLQAVRRYPRLTVPILASCTLAVGLQQLGLFHNVPAGQLAKSPWLESFYRLDMSWLGLLQFAGWDVYARYDGGTTYNAVLWTMPFEMLGSLLIFGLLWVSGPTRGIQASLVAAFIAWSASIGSPLLAFFLGMALAFAAVNAPPNLKGQQFHWFGVTLLLGILAIAMFRAAGGGPVALSMYAMAILASVQLSPLLQKFLSNSLSRHLGSLSFPLYLTHLLVFCSLSSYLVLAWSAEGQLAISSRISIALVSVGASLLAAICFRPVEGLAIRWSRRISRLATAIAATGSRIRIAERKRLN